MKKKTPIPFGRRYRKTVLRAERLTRDLHRKSRALIAARGRVKREVARRLALEALRLKTMREYESLLADAKTGQLRARRLAHRILSAQEDERREISRDLHDEIAQTLAGINVRLATLRMASAIDGAEWRKRIAETQRLVGRSVRIVHRYARELRPSMLDDLGLIPALRTYIRDLPGRKTLTIRFTAADDIDTLDNAGLTALYRVAQEALTNVIRHAHARHATVSLGKCGEGVRLEVSDDGRSFSPKSLSVSPRNGRLGLVGMRERVEMLGGELLIVPSPGKGTLVRADIPFVKGTRRRAS